MKTYPFENMEVWKESRQLVKMIYRLQATFPTIEKYGLGDQLRRAVISVSSNLVEGNARYSTKEQIHFFDIAMGSLMEVYCQVLLAYDLEYLSEEQLFECKQKIERVRVLLNGLRRSKRQILKTDNLS